MLPPKDMHLHCLRCKADLEPEQRACPSCGADREVEMAVAAELDPVVATLQRWLLLVGGLLVISGLVIYQKIDVMLPGLAIQLGAGLFLGLLALFARKAPLVVPALALALFMIYWGLELVVSGWAAVTPGLMLGLRIISLAILFDAVRGGYKARAIRKRVEEQIPRAQARIRS